MVLALYGLAAAMVAGGAWAIVQGLDYVVLERGWTMVIAGSVVATGGLLLLGIARAVAGLQRIETELRRAAERLARSSLPDAPPPRPNLANLSAALPDLPTLSPAPALGGGAASVGGTGLGVGGVGVGGLGAAAVASALGQGEAAAAPPPPPPIVEPPTRISPLLADAPVPRRTDPEDAPRTDPELSPADEGGPAILRGTQAGDEPPDEESRFAVHFDEPQVQAPEEPARDEPAPSDLRSTIVDAPEPDDRPDAAASEDEPADAEPEELTVLGTYSSGGNTYVMYSDGSIQADTPSGRFTFASLEELKEFIAAGGEGGPGDARG